MSRETFEFRIYCDGNVFFEDDYHEIPEDASDDYRTTRVEVDDDDNIYGDMSSLIAIKNAGFEYNFPEDVESVTDIASQLTTSALNAVNASASYYKPLWGDGIDPAPEDELDLPEIQRGMLIAFEYLDRYLDLCIHLDDDLYPDKFLADFHALRDELYDEYLSLSAKETVRLFTFFLRNCPQIEMIKHLPSTELHEMASGKGEAI